MNSFKKNITKKENNKIQEQWLNEKMNSFKKNLQTSKINEKNLEGKTQEEWLDEKMNAFKNQ
jgi:hypothetical protein